VADTIPLTPPVGPFPAGAFESSVGTPSAPNGTVPGPLSTTSAVKTYYCPSRRPAALYRGGGAGGRGVRNDYCAAVPPQTIPVPATPIPYNQAFYVSNWYGMIAPGNAGYNGNFYRSSKYKMYDLTKMADMTDGTSNTMAVAEKFLPVQC